MTRKPSFGDLCSGIAYVRRDPARCYQKAGVNLAASSEPAERVEADAAVLMWSEDETWNWRRWDSQAWSAGAPAKP